MVLDLVRSLDTGAVEDYRARRDYEGLDLYILEHLTGRA